MDAETLRSFDLTPTEMATFTALQEYTRDETQQQQNQHSSLQSDQSQNQHDIPSTPSYFNVDLDIDPQLLSPASAISKPIHHANSPAPFDAFNAFSPPTYTYPDPITVNNDANAILNINSPFNHLQPPYQQSPYPLTASLSSPYDPLHPQTHQSLAQNNNNMRHQLLGHRRSVSVPPEEHSSLLSEDFGGGGGGGVMTFSRGGTPLGESFVSNKRGQGQVQGQGRHGGGGGSGGGGRGKNGRVLLKSMARKRMFERAEEDAMGGGYHSAGDEEGKGGKGGGGRGVGGGGVKRRRYELRRSHTFGGGGVGSGIAGRSAPTSAPCSSPSIGGVVRTRGGGGGGKEIYYPPEMCAVEQPPPQPPCTSAPGHTWSQSQSPMPMSRLQHHRMAGGRTVGGLDAMHLQNSLFAREAETRWFEGTDVQELVARGLSGRDGASTAQLIALAKLDSLAWEVEGMKELVKRAFRGKAEHGMEEKEGDDVESFWDGKRKINGEKSSLDDVLVMLPFSACDTETAGNDSGIDAKTDAAAVEGWVPRTG